MQEQVNPAPDVFTELLNTVEWLELPASNEAEPVTKIGAVIMAGKPYPVLQYQSGKRVIKMNDYNPGRLARL